jgi:hypothetical protein
MVKQIYVFVDAVGDIVEYYPSNSNMDYVYQYKQYREKLHGPLKVHRAIVDIKEEIPERIHETSGKLRPAQSVKVLAGIQESIDTCQRFSLCKEPYYREKEVDKDTRCSVCPRK